MSPRTIANFCLIPTAVFLILIGVVHDIVGIQGLHRAIERGAIAARLGDMQLMNWAFSGAAMSLLGIILLLVRPGLRKGGRQAANVAVSIGTYVAAIGVCGYLWVPTRPSVLIFLFFGALLIVPLLVFRREFPEGTGKGP
jgi:hypothetical protein